jgi:DNA-binding response OmpR family regulator
MPKTVLAVDYDQKTLEEIRSILDSLNLTFLTAHDGTQAEDVFRSSVPDLVLTSALLPKLNGFELCKKISAGELGSIRPVIMFSGIYKAEKYRKEAIVGCGAMDFLEKPLVEAHLVKVVRNLLCQQHPVKPEPQLEPSPSQPEVLLDDTEPISMMSLIGEPELQIPGDPLDVDELFETRQADPILEVDPIVEWQEPVLTGPLVSEARTPLLPPESKDEIEAALATILIDSDREVQLRDQRIAEEIELEMAPVGLNILDLEQILEASSSTRLEQFPSENEIIELEDKELPTDSEPATVSVSLEEPSLDPEIPEKSTEASAGTPFFPSLTLDSGPSKNWIPFAIIALILLGTAVILLLGRH